MMIKYALYDFNPSYVFELEYHLNLKRMYLYESKSGRVNENANESILFKMYSNNRWHL
jgi:hypothetical protein